MIPPPVYLTRKAPVTIDMTTARAFALNAADLPFRTAIDHAERVAQAFRALDYLKVETSARYQRTPSSTWCNIYFADLIRLLGGYGMHVFWTPGALASWAAGKPQPVMYEKTVTEYSANMLYDWLVKWGPTYGFRRIDDAGKAQTMINAGGTGCACAKKLGGVGHVSVLLPESPDQLALTKNGVVLAPVQSQAGAKNRRLFATPWYLGAGYLGGLWVQP
jgi:hypothetical protein